MTESTNNGIHLQMSHQSIDSKTVFSSDIVLVLRSHHDLEMKIRHVIIRVFIRPQEILIELARSARCRLTMSLIVWITSDVHYIDFFLFSLRLALCKFYFVFLSRSPTCVSTRVHCKSKRKWGRAQCRIHPRAPDIRRSHLPPRIRPQTRPTVRAWVSAREGCCLGLWWMRSTIFVNATVRGRVREKFPGRGCILWCHGRVHEPGARVHRLMRWQIARHSRCPRCISCVKLDRLRLYYI